MVQVKGANEIDPMYADYHSEKKWLVQNTISELTKQVVHFYNIRWEAYLRIMTLGQKNKGKLFHNAWRVLPLFDDSDRPDFGPAAIATAKKIFAPLVPNYHEDGWAKCINFFVYYVTAK